jgi:hypothetical protein
LREGRERAALCEVLSIRVFALSVRSKELNPARPFRLSQCERD